MTYFTHDNRESLLCTGCQPPRPIIRESDQHEWQHLDDDTYAEVFHIHESSSSRDCDGRYDRGSVTRPNSYRDIPEDRDATWRKAANACFPSHAECKVEVADMGNGLLRMHYRQPTDEGFEAGELLGCDDPYCAYDASEFRDHTAERAGY